MDFQILWYLLKQNIKYDKHPILIVYTFCTICFITIWFGIEWDRNRPPLTMLIMIVALVMFVLVNQAKCTSQKRSLFLVSLPIPINVIGLLDLVYPYVIWLGLLILYLITGQIIQTISALTKLISPMHMLTVNGIILFLNAAYFFLRHLKSFRSMKQLQPLISVSWFIIYILALVPFYIMTNFFGIFGEGTHLQTVLNEWYQSPIIISFLGIVLSILSYVLFIKRKSYLD